ncbi:hypothetical protein [Streptomyces sp. NPDC014894]|uniref:hypothetical protein n=1 Tax=Streptomyces sp. NPDC014894 TaxID=3364931 RepID=UPI0036FEC60B
MSGDSKDTERYGPDGPFDDRTGNEMVNNGPDADRGNADEASQKAAAAGGAAEAGRAGRQGQSAQSAQSGQSAQEPGDTVGAPVGGPGSPGSPADEPAGDPAEEQADEPEEPAAADTPGAPDTPGTPDTPGAPAASGASAVPGASGAPGDPGGSGASGGELAEVLDLGALLKGAVDDLAPSEGALDHLRKAVPARRARKRQALVGVAAAVLLMGTAIPAFVHVASPGGGDAASPVAIGRDQHAQGGAGTEKEKEKEKGKASSSASGKPDKPKDKEKPEDKERASESPGARPGKDTGGGGGSTGGGAPDETPGGISSASLVCAAERLGVSLQEAGAPDAEGKVYGVFRVSNVSGTTCTVGGGGTIGVQTLGAADPAKVSVVRHMAGGPATGLPDPSLESESLSLEPSESYEVRFAWVPSETCPTEGGVESPAPTPSEGSASGETDGGGGTIPGEVTPQLATEDGGLLDGSVSVTHVAEPGAPTAQATIGNACAGTLYQTGLLSAG